MDAIKKLMKDPELFKTQALIGGKWAKAADGDTVDVRSTPAPEVSPHIPAAERNLISPAAASRSEFPSLSAICYTHFVAQSLSPPHRCRCTAVSQWHTGN